MAPGLEVLELSRLDQVVLRVYVRQLLIFPFIGHIPQSRGNAQATLTMGLLATLKQFPFLAGAVELSNRQTGELVVHYPSSLDLDLASQLLSRKDVDGSMLTMKRTRLYLSPFPSERPTSS